MSALALCINLKQGPRGALRLHRRVTKYVGQHRLTRIEVPCSSTDCASEEDLLLPFLQRI